MSVGLIPGFDGFDEFGAGLEIGFKVLYEFLGLGAVLARGGG